MASFSSDGRQPGLIDRRRSTLVVIDVQKRLIPKVRNSKTVLARMAALVSSAQVMDVPTVFTEHCRDSIGAVSSDLRALSGDAPVIPKTAFKATAEPDFTAHLVNLGRPQAVIAGFEAHVCVLQTALGLCDLGYDVFVVSDAIATRRKHDMRAALQRMAAAGVQIVSAEMVLFEWLETGDNRHLPKLLPQIKKLAVI